jgi:hypothetical protein
MSMVLATKQGKMQIDEIFKTLLRFGACLGIVRLH